MHVDDFFEELTSTNSFGQPRTRLRKQLLVDLRREALAGQDDLDCAIALLRLVKEEFTKFGTSGGERLSNEQSGLAQRAMRATLMRHDVKIEIPWSDFESFKAYWVDNGATGSYEKRRKIIRGVFAEPQEQLERLEEHRESATLAEAVSPREWTGWPQVDEEIKELKKRFRSASTPQDYRDVGNRSTAVLEAISRTVYVPELHDVEGEGTPEVAKTKLRIGRYADQSLAGADDMRIRGVATKVIELAHSVKHSTTPTRREAGIAADSVVMLAHILRRADQVE